MTWLIVLAVSFLAYANGANDNFKGVASLYGSGILSYRRALAWGTFCTGAGSVAALFLAHLLLVKFSGKGLVPEAVAGSPDFLLAVTLGAGGTVLLATKTGFPISTTHALTGAMLGSGGMAVGSQLNLGFLGRSFLLPLLISPLLAVLLGSSLYLLFRWCRLSWGITKEWCICVGTERQLVPIPQPSSVLALQIEQPVLSACVAKQGDCEERYAGTVWGLNCQRLMDACHIVSAGLVSFARGLNDTPKIAALLLVLPLAAVWQGVFLVGAGMAIGGLISARRVAETMSHRITGMNHGQGFSANLGTSLLVLLASLGGMPVSTTHVSVGALCGIGLVNRQADLSVIRNIVLSWVVTLPCAAALGATVFWLLA